MVTTTTHYTDFRYRAYPGEGYDGIVRVSYGGHYGTGTLLFDGRAVLTAAHLFEGSSGSASVSFETPGGTQSFSANKILQHPGYDNQSNNDLAIVWLSTSASVGANRYNIYRSSDEIGQSFTILGYGQTGLGSTGATDSNTSSPIRLKAGNRFDTDAGTLKGHLGSIMGWTPLPGTQLIADFDNGNATNDALGQLNTQSNLGTGLDEGLIAKGDSGGPAFIHNKVAGIASYTSSLSRGDIHPDVDTIVNSSFGEIASWQRVSAYQQWIDQSLRANYLSPPTKPEEVKKEVKEGNSGTSYAYFLLQFTGVRSDPDQILSVDYTTRDGTAMSGSDYLPASGTLNLYPTENQAVIPVEIIGDNTPEANETFYLDVYNAVGGNLGQGVLKLTAARTIINDDAWLG